MKFKSLLLCLPLIVFNTNVIAKQLNHQSVITTDTIDFKYSWIDHSNNVNNINFKLPKRAVAESYIDFKKPDNNIFRNYIISTRRSEIDNINNKQNKYTLKMSKENELQITGERDSFNKNEIDEIQKYINKKEEQAKFKFYYDNFYIWNPKESLVTIDYKRISNVYKPKITAIAEAFKKNNNRYMYDKRYVLNNVLSFYQTIPYDTLDRDGGFSTPFKLIHENKGDCDTKLVAFDSTIKKIYPEIQTIAIVIPGHVVIGLKIPYTKNDEKILYKGNYYVMAETAGPGLITIGNIAKESKAKMVQKNFSIIDLY